MGSLFFPQLSSGAQAQYPIKKIRIVRTIKNVLPDGSMILLSDPSGDRLVWQMAYTELGAEEANALQGHFAACAGPYHKFAFIDPTDNMLAFSSDLTAPVWQTSTSSLIQMSGGIADPEGGTSGFTATNTGQINAEIAQKLTVPASYQYCFSLYARANEASNLLLTRAGQSTQASISVAIGSAWTRFVSVGQLNDSGTVFTVSVTLVPGQQVSLFGLQLEPQLAPSRYRATMQLGGVYSNAHWGVDQLTISADAPNVYSTSFTIETAT